MISPGPNRHIGQARPKPRFLPVDAFGGFRVPNYPSTASSLSTALKIEKRGSFRAEAYAGRVQAGTEMRLHVSYLTPVLMNIT
jgi:hypothetical protein